jgi:hypothetical protein
LQTGRKVDDIKLIIKDKIDEGLDKIKSLQQHENTDIRDTAASIIEICFSDEVSFTILLAFVCQLKVNSSTFEN